MPSRPRAYWWVNQRYNYVTAIEQQTLWSLPPREAASSRTAGCCSR